MRASFLVSNHIARAKKPFTVGEESILPAAKNICLELLGESAIQKTTSVPLLASTIIRWIDETAEYTEAQLLERINESLQCTIQVDESTNVDKATMLVSMQYISQRMCKRVCYVPFCCQPIPQLQNYSSIWMITYEENWMGHLWSVYAQSGCHDWMDFCVYYSGQRGCFWTWDLHTLSSIEKSWLTEKCHLNLTAFSGCD